MYDQLCKYVLCIAIKMFSLRSTSYASICYLCIDITKQYIITC